MWERSLKALAEPDPENQEQILLLAPGLGLFRPSLPKGAFVTPDLKLGTLSRLERFYDLCVPEGARGAVLEQLVQDGVSRVEYRTPLLRVGAAGSEPLDAAAGAEGTTARAAAATGEIVVKSPTDGIFYRRPDPQAPAYVEVGAIVGPGAQLGLVEVMKCFNRIKFEGDSLPSRCEVISIPVEDAQEVAHGQPLFILRALGAQPQE